MSVLALFHKKYRIYNQVATAVSIPRENVRSVREKCADIKVDPVSKKKDVLHYDVTTVHYATIPAKKKLELLSFRIMIK